MSHHSGPADAPVRDRLPISTKIYYLFGDIGISMCIAGFSFFILFFYADIAGVSPGLVGTVLLLAKIWDAVTDPAFGWLSDRTRSRFGRRKAYLIFFSIPFGIAFSLLWFLPQKLAPHVLDPVTGGRIVLMSPGIIAWIVGIFFLYFTLFTITSVSYYAMTPELTRDYDERTSLITFRMVGGTIGYMAGAALPPVIAGMFKSQDIGWFGMGLVFATVTIICLYITVLGVKQRPELEGPPSELPAFTSMLTCFKNKPFDYLMVMQVASGICFMLVMSYMAFFLTYVMDMEAQIPILMILLLVTIGVFLVFWKWLMDKWGKKGPVYALGLFIAFSATASTFFLPQGGSWMIYPIIFIAGFGFSAQWVCPWSIFPDVLEHDELMTGERREGLYYGVKGLIDKISNAFALFVGGWVLELFGFVAGAEQTPQALLGIRLFFGPVPALVMFLSFPFLIWFPITRKTHLATLAELERRSQQ
jgi:GPH family glycoside/pentoside/hexuronide:cation symporter